MFLSFIGTGQGIGKINVKVRCTIVTCCRLADHANKIPSPSPTTSVQRSNVGKASPQCQWVISSRQTQASSQIGIRDLTSFNLPYCVFYPVLASSCRPPVPIIFCYFLPLFLSCRLFCWQDKIRQRVQMLASVSLQPPPSSPPAGASAIRLREHLKDASGD